MKAPVIVFTDDTDVFERPEGVTRYFEPWIVKEHCEALDSEGRVLKLNVKTERRKFLWIFPYNQETLYLQETNDIKRDYLKSKIIAYLEACRTSSIGKGKSISADLFELSHEDLIKELVTVKGFTK